MVKYIALALYLLFPFSANAEDWIHASDVDSFEILYASPTTKQVESLAGHLLLRVHFNTGEEDTVVAFGAAVRSEEKFTQFRKGLFGGYKSLFVIRTLSEAIAYYNEYEGRDLLRYSLKLTRKETESLVARLNAVYSGKRYSYKFFTKNCATLLVRQIADATGDSRILAIPSFLKSPQAALSRLLELGYAKEIEPSFWVGAAHDRTRGTSHTGILPIAVGAGFVGYKKLGKAGTSYELLLSSAYFSEKLGSRARLRFAAGSDLSLFPVSVSISADGLQQLQAMLLGVRPIGNRVGFSVKLLDLDWNLRGEDSRLLMDWIRGDFLLKLAGSAEFRSFVLLSIGAAFDNVDSNPGVSLPAALEAQYSVDHTQNNIVQMKFEARGRRRAKGGMKYQRALGEALGSDWVLSLDSSVEKMEDYKDFKILLSTEAKSW